MNRRKFFSRSALVTGGVVAFPHLSRAAEAAQSRPGQKPNRIIHMVADGMSLGTLTCADYFSRHLRKRGMTWMELAQKSGVRHGLMNMRSLNSIVTDSSAASSSWGSGSRVANGAVNRLPSGKALTPLYTLFGQAGWKRGLVTTTEITHATPAGFAASVDTRDDGSQIAAQYLERKIEVLLGGGQKFFKAAQRKDKRDLKGEFARAGYHVMEASAGLAAASTADPWLGVFSESHVPYTLDAMADAKIRATVPSLAAMTGRSLEWLERHEHFILQVEGGRVDHGAHNCDAAATMREMIAFDEALDLVVEFQQRRPDTLVVITTDHGNGNMGVNSGSKSSQMFQRVGEIKGSFPEILRQLRQRPSVSTALVAEDLKEKEASAATKEYVPDIKEIQGIIEASTGYKASEKRAALFQAFLAKQGVPLYDLMNSEMVQLGQLLANHIAVGWTSGAHTSDYVPVTAFGPGAEKFEGFIQNTDVFRHYTQLAGIDFQNPQEPLTASLDREAWDVERAVEYMFA